MLSAMIRPKLALQYYHWNEGTVCTRPDDNILVVDVKVTEQEMMYKGDKCVVRNMNPGSRGCLSVIHAET